MPDRNYHYLRVNTGCYAVLPRETLPSALGYIHYIDSHAPLFENLTLRLASLSGATSYHPDMERIHLEFVSEGEQFEQFRTTHLARGGTIPISGLCTGDIGPCFAIYIQTETHLILIHNDTFRPIRMIEQVLEEKGIATQEIRSMSIGFNPGYHTQHQITQLENDIADTLHIPKPTFIKQYSKDIFGISKSGDLCKVPLTKSLNPRITCAQITTDICSIMCPKGALRETDPGYVGTAIADISGTRFILSMDTPVTKAQTESPTDIFKGHKPGIIDHTVGSVWRTAFYAARTCVGVV